MFLNVDILVYDAFVPTLSLLSETELFDKSAEIL